MKAIKYITLAMTALVFQLAAASQSTAFKLPKYEKVVLKNGLTVYLMEQHEVPKISVSVILPAGAIYDGDQAGLASLTAASLKHGTRSYSKAQLDETLDFMGASIGAYASKESAGLSASFLSKDKEKVLGIIHELLTAPKFDTAEFAKEKKRTLTRLEQSKESPRSVIDGQFDKTMGTISFRATFPNPGGMLRSGNTGKVRIPQLLSQAVVVPQEATFEIQDKVFVFAVGDSNKVASKPITISGKTAHYYFVESGLQAGEKIVFAGTGNLQDGMVIVPQPISTDSLLKAKPL